MVKDKPRFYEQIQSLIQLLGMQAHYHAACETGSYRHVNKYSSWFYKIQWWEGEFCTSEDITKPLLCLLNHCHRERATGFSNYYFFAWTYFNCRGSQSTPGSKSLAACRTSSLSTEKLRRCPAWAKATLIHSIRGGSTMNGLERAKQDS